VLVGAGGAGSAVGYAALHLGVGALEVHDMDPARAATLAERLAQLFPERVVRPVADLRVALAAADGLIHASPTGMAKLPGLPVPAECLRPPLWIAEVVYVPLETELLRVARAAGCRTLDGGGMAVFQAVKAFELFCGFRPDAERMLSRFDAKLRATP
jgi:shikimate dehydrogenase